MAAEFLAQAEEIRGEGNVRFALDIASHPGHPSAGSLPLYAESARRAFESAAANTEQPSGWVR